MPPYECTKLIIKVYNNWGLIYDNIVDDQTLPKAISYVGSYE